MNKDELRENCITVVSGLPRSGTSMMMRMLKASGMEILTDNIRQEDEDNPHGYFELEKVKEIRNDTSWLAEAGGKTFKMVSLLLYNLPSGYRYKIIFMKRNMKETIASQNKMLRRSGKDIAAENDEETEALYTRHLAEIEEWLSVQPFCSVLYVQYSDVVADPEGAARSVNEFLGGGLDVSAMTAAVDRNLYRNRA